MATIGQKEADAATFIDDMRSILTGVTGTDNSQGWVEADSYVDNSGSNGTWENNGFVLYNDDFGIYMLMWLASNDSSFYDGGKNHQGVTVVFSTDWDSTNHHPSGQTTVANGKFPDSGDVGFGLRDSYQNYSQGNNSSGLGIAYKREKPLSGTAMRDPNITYVLSADTNYFTVGVWDNDDGNKGQAATMVLERTTNKFWNDGVVPFVCEVRTSWRNYRAHCYGFRNFAGNDSGSGSGNFKNSPYTHSSAWGTVNPDPNDDTFFFRRPVIHYDTEKRIPGTLIYNVAHNDVEEGAAHGDTLRIDGKDFRAFKQSGASTSDLLSTALRFE